jgi:hypothetical protein
MLFHSFEIGNVYIKYLKIPPPLLEQPNSGLGHLIVVVLRSYSTPLGGTLLAEGSACHRDLYMTTHNTPNRQTSMPLEGFKPAIPACKQSQTCTLDCRATRIE